MESDDKATEFYFSAFTSWSGAAEKKVKCGADDADDAEDDGDGDPMISPPPQSLRVQEERTGKERTEKKQNSPSERKDNEPIHRCCRRRLSSSNRERERKGGREM